MTWIDLIDPYAKTLLDFGLLRPRRFIVAKNRDPSSYLSPYQFLFVSLLIGFVIYGAAFSLILSANEESAGLPPGTLVNAVGVVILCIFVSVLIVNSLIFRVVSRIWPVRGNATFSSILEIQCYVLGIRLLPVMVLTLILSSITAIIAVLGKGEMMSAWGTTLDTLIVLLSAVIGVLTLLFWEFPGVAAANGVSTLRLWIGYVFWSVAPVVVAAIVVGGFLSIRSGP